MKHKLSKILALLVVVSLLLAACAQATTEAPQQTAEPVQPTDTTAPEPTEVMTEEPEVTEEVTEEPEVTEEATTEPEPIAGVVGETFKIGFVPAITGPGSSLGAPEHETGQMIAKQLEEQGGIVGPDDVRHPVELIIYDTETNPDVAVSVVRRLIEEDKVQIVVAGTTSGVSMAIVPIATEAEVPYISMASAGAIVKDPETGEVRTWVFKTAQDNLASAKWQADYLTAVGLTKVCHLSENSGYGADTLAQAEVAFADAGIEIVYKDSFERTGTEFPQIVNVQTAGCDAVVVGAIPPASSNISIALRDALPDMPIIHGHGTCNQDHIDLMGAEVAEGMVSPCGKVMVADTLPDDDPQKELLLKYAPEYTDFTGKPVNTFGGHGWDAIMLAVNALGSLTDGLSLEEQRAQVRDYLENEVHDWPGISGVYNLSPEDHFSLDYTSLTFVKVESGKWVYFPPEEWK
jgi:branched-chain amino acid transport system substrate-binding protein